MPYYKGGHNKLAKVCNQVLNLIHIHPQLLSQDSHLFTIFTLAVLPGVATPHLKRGATTMRHYRSSAATLQQLNWPLGLGEYLYLSHSSLSNGSSSSPSHLDRCHQLFGHFLSSPLVTLSSQAFFCDFPINPWEKRLQNSIREQILCFPKPKSMWLAF